MKVKVCVPLTASAEEEILAQAKEIACTKADIAEWRGDFSPALLTEEALVPMLHELKQRLGGKALLFTIRTCGQGGKLPYQAEQYERLLSAAIQSGCIDYVDLEDSTERDSMERLIALAQERQVRSIASYHNFEETPPIPVLLEKFEQLRRTGADILKTAYMPKDATDVAALLYATAAFREVDGERHELITMSMGALGRISRAGAGVFGSSVSFASVCEASAPGQMPIDVLLDCLEVFA